MHVGRVEDAVWKMFGGLRFGTTKRTAEAIRRVAMEDAREIVEDAVWRIIYRNEFVDDRFLPCCVDVG